MMDEQNEEIKTDTDGLEKCKQRCEEYLNNWKRERADFLNYKKDEAKRMEEFLKFGTEGLIIELLDAVDGIEVARSKFPAREELKDWLGGFDSSLDKLDKFLKKFGIEKIKVKGETFDPLLHEAVAVSSEASGEGREVGGQDGERIEEIRPGYTMHGKVIR